MTSAFKSSQQIQIELDKKSKDYENLFDAFQAVKYAFSISSN